MVGELEAMYVEMLDGHGIAWSTHVFRFAELLLSRVPELLKGFSGKKLRVFFDSTVQNNIQNNQDFFESLVNIVGPVRQAMHLKRRSLKKNRHDQPKEAHFPLYVAIKIYSHSCSKTMINWLHLCAGFSISYNRLLDITRDLANRILHQYKRDGVFTPCNLAKDNIDRNARSTTATKHYHGTSFSVFQFPSVAFPGDIISYPAELPTTTKSSNSKNVDSLPSSCTEIRRFPPPSTSLTFLIAPIPVLLDFDSVVHQHGVKEEYEWLESAYDDKTSY